jgi:hypothetical protein
VTAGPRSGARLMASAAIAADGTVAGSSAATGDFFVFF